MTMLELKKELHSLIDKIEDEELLTAYYEALQLNVQQADGELWDGLTKEQQQRVLDAYKQSESDESLIDHDAILTKHKQWFSK